MAYNDPHAGALTAQTAAMAPQGGMTPNIYGDLLNQQSDTIMHIRGHVEATVRELEEKRDVAAAKKQLLTVFRKDVQESFAECRSTVKKAIGAMINHLKQQQDEMLSELDATLQLNIENVSANLNMIDKALHSIDAQVEEGKSLLRENDMFTFYAKGSLYAKLPQVQTPPLQLEFKDNFPDLTAISILPYQWPLQHAVNVDMRSFLSSGVQTRICGNIFHNGFRFQIQLKHDDRYLSAYLCLRAWHDVASFLKVTVNFTLTLQDGPELLHTATAKNTFEGPNDGWGWNKFVPLTRLQDCHEVLFVVNFNELTYQFIQEENSPRIEGHSPGQQQQQQQSQMIGTGQPPPMHPPPKVQYQQHQQHQQYPPQ